MAELFARDEVERKRSAPTPTCAATAFEKVLVLEKVEVVTLSNSCSELPNPSGVAARRNDWGDALGMPKHFEVAWIRLPRPHPSNRMATQERLAAKR